MVEYVHGSQAMSVVESMNPEPPTKAAGGARASVRRNQYIAGPATATVGAEAFAGIGAEFEANVGLQDGKLSANFDVGAALGIGASVEFGVELDVGKAVDTVKDIGGGIANAAEKVFGGW